MALSVAFMLAGSNPAVGGAAVSAGSLPPVTDPGTLCVVAFDDANADGDRGSAEPAQSGWVVTVRDRYGATVDTLVTDAAAAVCTNLAAGIYTVAERAQPSWLATPAGSPSRTVTLVSAATMTVAFANHRCCSTFTFRAGIADDFSLANGASTEMATPVSPSAQPAYFDATRGNRVLAQRFRLGMANCVVSATLRARLRTLPGGSPDDTLRVRVPGGSSWARRVAAISPMGPWTYSPARPTEKTVVLDLAALPSAGGSISLLASINATHILDVFVQDDTSVDYIRLAVTFGACPSS